MKLISIRLSAALLALMALASFSTFAQDAGQVLRLSVGFRTMKNTVQMSDEKRKEIEALEAKARAATSEQKYGEALKHLYRGFALMRNQAWTPIAAMAVATEAGLNQVVFDPGDTARMTLKQIFTLDEPVEGKLKGALSIAVTKNGKQETLQELKQLADVEADFTKPFSVEAAIPDLPDGNYEIVIKLYPKSEELLYKSNSIRIARGAVAQANQLKSRIETVKADLQKRNQQSLLSALPAVEYDASVIQMVNSGDLPIARTDVKAKLAEASNMLDQIAKGEHPLKTRRGDIHWAYRSAVDDSLQPYRFFVPGNYDASKKWPLVVALHGMGGDENSFFAGYSNGEIKRLAEARGYLLVCPKGRAPASMYMGSAEKDVIDVLNQMKRDYSIDDDRIYLMGHSMGGYGTWSVAVNHPELFAALAPIAGGGNLFVTSRLKNITHVPWIVVHGDKDPTVPVEESRKMVKAGEALGIKIKYNEVPGGNHSNIVVPAFKDIFDWFDAHKRQPKAAAKADGNGQ